jgi:hypothetical protein
MFCEANKNVNINENTLYLKRGIQQKQYQEQCLDQSILRLKK